MADRIITVTDVSVVTNDTLDSYNNYTNQPSADTLLGPMTIGEAAAGKTVALTDGLVHEVTTKPVGTTNGEFSAVVSNAVTVDLSTPSGGFEVFGISDADPVFTKTETEAGFTNNYMTRTTALIGAFTLSRPFVELTELKAILGVGSSPINQAFSDGTNPWEAGIYTTGDGANYRRIVDGVSENGGIPMTLGVGAEIRVKRDGSNVVKGYFFDGSTETELYDFGAIAGNLYMKGCMSAENDTITLTVA